LFGRWWRLRVEASRTGAATAVGGVAITGINMASITITAPVPRSDYLAQVRQIAPERLLDRDAELEQLAELLGEPLPALLSDATRDAHLLGMLYRAAEACRGQGRRLVLVVDGIDEDRGVTLGPDAHSIAALLPARCRPGCGSSWPDGRTRRPPPTFPLAIRYTTRRSSGPWRSRHTRMLCVMTRCVS
jgi:hypothetical protein